jgi:serine/threonine-protein kinase
MEIVNQIIHQRYKVQQKIGEGNLSTVYAAVDPKNESRKFALKFLKTEKLSLRMEDMIRFEKEIQRVSQFGYPGLVRIFDIGEWKNQFFLAMELVEGMSLSKMLKKNPEFFTISNTVQLISYLGETLKYLHQSRIVHQSLKPGNILIPDNQFPEIKLVDFGLAHFMDIGWFFQHSDFIETLHYYSPEQTGLLKRAVDHRSDLYSLGIIFYELLTGAPPLSGKRTLQTDSSAFGQGTAGTLQIEP